MRTIVSLPFILLFFSQLVFSSHYTVSGYISNAGSGESLINASLYDKFSTKGCVSNSFGFYSITLPAGNVELSYSYVGLNTQIHQFNLIGDTLLNIKLAENTALNEIIVRGQSKGLDVKSTQMSAINIPVSQVKNVPGFLGESDILKVMQLMPGVKAGNEGSAGMYVRGGGPEENLLLLDGVPIYNVNHLFGFFSIFNTDAIKDVTLYKGSFPARFGGRLSSVVDVRMNDGNDQQIHGVYSIGLISSKFNLEGPIIKSKTTFNVSGRRTYADILALPLIAYMAYENNGGDKNTLLGYYFYDFNAKLSHKFSERNKLSFSFYTGDDIIYGNMQQYVADYGSWYKETGRLNLDWNWGNMVSALRWNHVVNNKLFMNATASVTKYRFNMIIGTQMEKKYFNPDSILLRNTEIGFKSSIIDYAAKVDFDWAPNPDHDVKFGFNYINHLFKPGVNVLQEYNISNSTGLSLDTTYGDRNVTAHEMSVYIEDDYALSKAIKINAGIHYSVFYVDGKVYNNLPSPRLSARYLINNSLSVKTAYSSMNQYVHLLSNSNVSLPTDLWVPVTKRIPPMKSQQFAAGVFYNYKNLIDFSIEAYYKTLNDLVEYKDGAGFLGGDSNSWEDKVSLGRGVAYGIELMAQKTVGNTTGWISYTWSRSLRLFNRPDMEINDGLWFPAKYDRPHSFSLVAMHKFNKKIDVSANWIISSGQCGSLALHTFNGESVPADASEPYQQKYVYLESRNNYRFEPYHRLDFSVNFHKQKKHGVRTWNVSIYNVYNKLNPFFVRQKMEFVRHDEQLYERYKIVFEKVSIFPIIPSISYIYKF